MRLKTVFILMMTCVLAGGMPVPASNNDTFSKGIDEFDAGRWTPAADMLKKAAAEKPGDEVVRLTTGVALANVKRYPEAAEQFEWAIRIAPQGVVPLLLLDGTYTELGNAEAAKQARGRANSIISLGTAFGAPQSSDRSLKASLVKYPRNAIAYCLLGDSLQLEGKLEAAKQQYAKSAGLSPMWAKPVFNLGLAYLQTDAKAAEVNFARAIELDPDNGRAHLWLGDAYLKQQQPEKAVEAYNRAAKDGSLVAEAQTRIGNAQMRSGNYAVAQQAFRMAEAVAPQDPRPVAGQAQVYQNIGDLGAAESKYKQAGDIIVSNSAAPGSQAVVSRQMADVQVAQGRLADAHSNYSLTYDYQPSLSNGYALASSDQKSSKLPESIASYEAALRKSPRDTRAMVYLLAAYKLTGNVQGRLDMAQRLVKADPTKAGAYNAELGCARMAAGDEKGAVDAFAQALDAGDAAVWETTAKSAMECGALASLTTRYDQAFGRGSNTQTGKVLFELLSVTNDTTRMVSTAEKLARLAPDDASILLRLGQAYERAGRAGEALAVYARVAAGPNAAAASAARGRIGAVKGGK